MYYFLKSVLKNPTTSLLFRTEERFCLITYCVFEKQSWLRNNDTYQWMVNFCYTHSLVQLGQWQIVGCNWIPKYKGKEIAKEQGTAESKAALWLQRGEEHRWWSEIRDPRSDPSFWQEGDITTQILSSTSLLTTTHQITNERFQTSKMIPNLLMKYFIKNEKKA